MKKFTKIPLISPLVTLLSTPPWSRYTWRMFRANLIIVTGIMIISGSLAPYNNGNQSYHILRGLPLAIYLGYIVVSTIIILGYAIIRIQPIIAWQRSNTSTSNSNSNSKTTHKASLTLVQNIVTMPIDHARIIGLCWICGSILLSSRLFASTISVSIFYASMNTLGGVVSCTICYLQAERTLSGLRSEALGHATPPRSKLNISHRIYLVWIISTGIPLSCVIVLLISKYLHIINIANNENLLVSIGAINLAALILGVLMTMRITASIHQPLNTMKLYLQELQRGNYHTDFAIDDLSGIGTLQAGLYNVAHTLAEKEIISDLFGRYVGEQVAQNALVGGTALGGKECQVAIIFIDIVSSTELSHRYTPQEVVAILNHFFHIVVEITTQYGGLVNKFIGDAALIVFNTPNEQKDYHTKALMAGRALAKYIDHMIPHIKVGIGISCGPVIAGLMGAQERFEFAVTGDAVNEASRLVQLAKTTQSHVCATKDIIDQADPQEKQYWLTGPTVVLRGRLEPTIVMYPSSEEDFHDMEKIALAPIELPELKSSLS